MLGHALTRGARRLAGGVGRCVQAARRPLGGVGPVVDSGAEDVAPRHGNRRVEPDRGERERGTGRLRLARTARHRLDERERTDGVRTLAERERHDRLAVARSRRPT